MIHLPFYLTTKSLEKKLLKLHVKEKEINSSLLVKPVVRLLHEAVLIQETQASLALAGFSLSQDQISSMVRYADQLGAEAYEGAVRGYWMALLQVDTYAGSPKAINEPEVRRLHAFVMGEHKRKSVYSSYREEGTEKFVADLLRFIHQKSDIPVVLRAGLLQYAISTKRLFTDGNERLGRILARAVLSAYGYQGQELGLYSVVSVLAEQKDAYREALYTCSVESAGNDATMWLEYFCGALFDALCREDELLKRLSEQDTALGKAFLEALDGRQKVVLSYFYNHETITINQIAQLCCLDSQRAYRLAMRWLSTGFLVCYDAHHGRGRKLLLAPALQEVCKNDTAQSDDLFV